MQVSTSRTKVLKLGNPLKAAPVAGFRFAADANIGSYCVVAQTASLHSQLKPLPQRSEGLSIIHEESEQSPDPQALQLDYPQFASLLGECGRRKTLHKGRKLHSLIVCSSLDRKALLGNLLIKMYDACGHLLDACSVFNGMQSRNVISWTLLINAYTHHNDHRGAMDCFREMHVAGVKPNNVTLVSILAAVSIDQGMIIHACVVEFAFDADPILETALINMYRKCGSLENLRWLFDRMDSRDVVAWNTLIAAYVHHGKLCDSIQLYLQMGQSVVEPNHVTFTTLLGACCNPKTVLQGLALHGSIVEAGLESDAAIGSALVTMYSKCKSVDEAQNVFTKAHSRDIIMWNAMITARVDSGHQSQALSIYEEMRAQTMPNHITFIGVLSACTTLVAMLYGMAVHASVIFHNLESHNPLGTALLNLYGKCGDVKSARRIFEKLPSKDLVTWNAMLSVYALNELEKEAFQFYRQMRVSNMIPDRFTFNTLLGACYRPSFLSQGLVLHNDINIYGMERQAGIGVGLVGMYNKCSSVEAARIVFEQQDKHDLTLWNTMLSGYVQSDQGKEALLLFKKMGMQGANPDGFTFSAVVSACSDLATLGQGKVLHAAVVDGGFDSDGAVDNALVHMYCKCGNMEDAWSVFKNHHDQNIISWNALVSGYAQHGHGYEALQVFKRMQRQNIKASKVTFVGVFAACAHVGLVEEGMEYFNSMKEVCGILPDLEHYASIVDLFGRVGRIKEADDFVQNFPVQPDVVVWKVLLGSCRVHKNRSWGRSAAEHAVELDLENSMSYVILSNLCAEYEDFGWI